MVCLPVYVLRVLMFHMSCLEVSAHEWCVMYKGSVSSVQGMCGVSGVCAAWGL